MYCCLRRCEDQKAHRCRPSCKALENAVGMYGNTVGKYVQMLAERGLIAVEPTTVITKPGTIRT